ncbi:MAG: hypothetical protein H6685_03965 [Deltaproteobacteria bacterium]|nr:hypothetical protein [Deltaproteobacteria bacterium]
MNDSAPSPLDSPKALVWVLVAALLPFAFMAYPPLQDLPDWSYQARIVNEVLAGNPAFTADYALVPAPVPNSAIILTLALLTRVLGPIVAAKLLAVGSAIFFAFAYVLFVRRRTGTVAPRAELIGAYFAVGHFFWMGYLNFQIGVAAALLVLALLPEDDKEFGAANVAFLAVGLVVVYLCHFLAYSALAICLLGREAHRSRFDWRGYVPLALASVPSVALGLWYAAVGAGRFGIWYEYQHILNWIWYKAGPFTPVGGFYPVSPHAAQWTVAAMNAVAVAGLGVLFVSLIINAAKNRRSPWTLGVAVLLLVGFIGPTRFFEVIRPSERWLYFGVLVLLGTSASPWLRRPISGWLSAAAVVAAMVTSLLAFHASGEIDAYVRDVERVAPPGEAIMILTDRHQGFRPTRALDERLRDPYSYPNWVDPLKFAPYWVYEKRGGLSPTIFPTGVVRVQSNGLKVPATYERLADPAIAAPFGAVAISGRDPYLSKMRDAAAQAFHGREISNDHFAVIARR